MPALTRRQLLVASGLAPVAACLRPDAATAAQAPAFVHGVASGDPLPDAVMLWTRVQTTAPITWRVARDPALAEVVAQGSTTTSADRDFTVKVDATGLPSGSRLFYGFRAEGVDSPVGRTRTAPTGSPERLRMGVVTCGDFSRGLFNAYGRVADEDDLDAVVHLGDYIYEGYRATGRVRLHVPAREVRTVQDYRLRYASYRLDPLLQRMHQRHPFIWVWDDHETVDGTWMSGADPSNDPAEGAAFEPRKLAARTAAQEWLPIRLPDPADPERIYRRFSFGDLVELFMLDTRRIGRVRQGEPNGPGGTGFTQTGVFADPARQLLGAAQERWLFDGLAASRAAWKLLGNQVVLSPLKLAGAPNGANPNGGGVFANPDQWDGYSPARNRLLDVIEGAGRGLLDPPAVPDVIVLTGDVHAALAFEVTRDPNNPAAYDPVSGRGAAVELVTPSISSAGDPRPATQAAPDELADQLVVEAALRGGSVVNPHLKHSDTLNGWLLLDIDRERVRAEFRTVPTVATETDQQDVGRVLVSPRGTSRLLPELLPPAVVPEVPLAVALPVVAAGVLAAATVARRGSAAAGQSR